jgi:hypothetical protein
MLKQAPFAITLQIQQIVLYLLEELSRNKIVYLELIPNHVFTLAK